MKETITIMILLVLLTSSFEIANGHKPLKVVDSNNDFSTAKEIPNHKISWGIYEELSGSNDVHYYKFAADEGDRLYAQISIPKLEKFSTFVPSIALVGSKLTAGNLEAGYSVREYAHDIGDLPFAIPPGMRAIVGEYNGQIPSSEFYEPFTQTSYWERQKIVINSLPSVGTYYLVVFDRNLMEDAAKYTLAVGEIEDFSLLDLFTIIPSAWLETKFFFEDYISPTIAISLLVVEPSLITILRVKQLRRRYQSKTLQHR
ncbi:MAG TPA: hypothetical protein VGE97_03725 [Nitrososphaera sp.]